MSIQHKSAILNEMPELVENLRPVYNYDMSHNKENCNLTLESRNQLLSFLMSEYGEENCKEALKIIKNNNKRVKRLKTYLKKMFQQTEYNARCYFITLTFVDQNLKVTSEETRRRYVARALKGTKNVVDYIANIDYGESEKGTHREHYHAVILINGQLDYKEFQERYQKITKSASYIREIRASKTSKVRLAKYLSKLTNHAIKESTKNKHLIYCKQPCYNLIDHTIEIKNNEPLPFEPPSEEQRQIDQARQKYKASEIKSMFKISKAKAETIRANKGYKFLREVYERKLKEI